ncbi:MAG: MBL fold metallo-hydrolase [Culicoidibacterales bacterium]
MKQNKYRIESFISELAGERTYLCINTETNDAIIVDPSTLTLDKVVEGNKYKIRAILVTHGHFDHIFNVDYYEQKYNVPVYIHELEKAKLTDPSLHLGSYSGFETFIVEATPIILKGGSSVIEIEGFPITYFLAPGHSVGNTVFMISDSNIYFVGDSVFKDSIGRYDLPGSNAKDHLFALRKYQELPAKSKIYPGHGKAFYVEELAENEVYQRFIQLGI